jgi:hypothetical protein
MSWTSLTSTSSQAPQPTAQAGAATFIPCHERNINYTATYPAQTALTAFNTSAEAFVANSHWSSSEVNASNGGSSTSTTAARAAAARRTASPRSCLPPHRAVMPGSCSGYLL